MDIRTWAGLGFVPLVGVLGLVVPAAPAAVAAPAAAAIRDLYVNSKACDPRGYGTPDAPFCTISGAAALAAPGQTVLVQPGDYPEAVTITRSGEVGAPITFRAVNGPDGTVTVGDTTVGAVTGAVFALNNVHDIVVEGFRLQSPADQSALVVNGSQRVTLDGVIVHGSRATLGAVRVTGRSGGVTVSRSYLSSAPAGNPSLAIDAGVVGAVVSGNELSYSGLRVTDAPGTTITNNTLLTYCAVGIEVAGASTGVSVQNNIVRTHPFRQACATPANATAISVSAGSVPGTFADHNLIDPITGGALYAWGDGRYQDLPAFRQATGQGGHDLAADPMIGAYNGSLRPWHTIDPSSPAVDSGDASARGATGTDMLGNPRTDNPAIANSGTGAGYHDRGAVEAQGAPGGQATVRRKPGGNPFAVTASGTPQYGWPVGGEGGSIAYQFEGEQFWRVTTARTLDHTFRRAGQACAHIRISYTGFRLPPEFSSYRCTQVGALYETVQPTRLLDTREALGTPTTTPVPAKSEVILDVPSINGVAAADLSAVVLNVTVTQPSTAGFLTVYPDGAPLPTSSNVNFVANETVPNLATVPMTNGKLRFRNSSGGTVHVIADLQGFYGSYGAAMQPLTPIRALDTRTGAGTPIAANGYLRLDLTGKVPAEAKAAIVNVTVTAPTAGGVLTLYPDTWPTPMASNVNFVAGQTIPNLVIVPLVAGKAMIRNASSGTTHVVADVAGYFAAPSYGVADQTYVPYGSYRIADSRGLSGWDRPFYNEPFHAGEKATVSARHDGEFCEDDCPTPRAAVVNVTVTDPTTAGVLAVYPPGGTPSTSTVNFLARETASNLAVVKVGAEARIAAYNNSSGSTHVIVDQSGYFIAAP
ncbi:right-handed parallel beta-helix repeat-containing protein [Micromonospora sp. RHAY321]|uniref:right-handed parallel beta-helix repeat-containing protein n=1 Tax=Micromonospora sp. RHAY321 TaxID=2944807 RepID=UPI00207C8E7E|nr:right-handed parallel beta-helix repeat-containing protein [Micromonospora sp. RHAY321]MCO1596190.1 right-handed parallel beta-helix repeat-containing protein [Micromonospora sp. RHAY321]